eukprot:TRINITY_DN8721_c0_g1_i1.p1 TRINITY_DN8721_c0_g1~~TRINITY_DN8721_c0_g1_i1.p1  ORF type:complete len:780 (+),score=242.82 TRINITY_DN8721_c0_g1_i1:44-2383(+)
MLMLRLGSFHQSLKSKINNNKNVIERSGLKRRINNQHNNQLNNHASKFNCFDGSEKRNGNNKKQFERWIKTNNLNENMKRVRNIGIVAHVDAGKTTTAECMLYYSGQIKRIGDVDDGNTVMDFLKMERERGITIQSAAISFPWKDYRFNLIDTPGHVDFTVEVERSVRVLDGAVTVLDAVSGVQAQTETVWRQINRYKTPRIAFINKMDRDGASFGNTINSMKNKLRAKPIPIHYPLSQGNTFEGIVDLIRLKTIRWEGDSGEKVIEGEFTVENVGENVFEEAKKARTLLLENLAEVDEGIMNSLLEGNEKDLKEEQLEEALKKLTCSLECVPVLCGTALKRKGVQNVLDAVIKYLPSPIERTPVKGNKTVSGKKGASTQSLEVLPDPNAPLCALAYKVTHDKFKGLIVYFRVYSGTMRSGSVIKSMRAGDHKERIMKLFEVSAQDLIEKNEIQAGDIGAAVGLKGIATGDTIVLHSDTQPIQLEGIQIPPPVFLCSIEPQKASEEKKLDDALKLLQLEDPSFHLINDVESGQLQLSGMGELHLDIITDRILNHYDVEASVGNIFISYRTTLGDTVEDHKSAVFDFNNKGGAANLTLELRPNERGVGFTMENSCKKTFDSALDVEEIERNVEEGVKNGLRRGVYGYSMIDVHATIKDWDINADSSPAAFKKCATLLTNKMTKEGNPIILEPVMKVELNCSEEHLGSILSDVTGGRRGSVESVEGSFDKVITAIIPLKELVGYSTTLRSQTQGNGSFSMEFLQYDAMSSHQQDLFLKRKH